MASTPVKTLRRVRRKRGLRKRICGTSDRPRLSVFRSAKHIYAQIIDDLEGVTLCHAGTKCTALRDKIDNAGNRAAAAIVGAELAARAKAKQIETVCLDRNGFRFHGRVKSLADAAREAGLKF